MSLTARRSSGISPKASKVTGNGSEILGAGETAATAKPSVFFSCGAVGMFNETPDRPALLGEPVQAAKYWKMLCGGMPNCKPTGTACWSDYITLGQEAF